MKIVFIKKTSKSFGVLNNDMEKIIHGVEFKHRKIAVVEIADNIVIITSGIIQPHDIEIFWSHGINPHDQKILVVKSAVHYRATFEKVTSKMIPLALSGYSVPILQAYKYIKWKGNV